MAYAARAHAQPAGRRARTASPSLGYAVPGAVIAVGVLMPLGRLDHALAGWLESAFGMRRACC